MVQAMRLGYKEVVPDSNLGYRNDVSRPRTYCKFVTERKEDFAWENDRVAFRVYSRAYAPDKLMSGVDLWPKSVDYSIIDKWYEGNLNGISYHIDTGEGCDFYNMGKGRGIGGLAFARGGDIIPVEAYSNWRISDNSNNHIEFTLSYQPVNVSGDTYYASQTIEMVNGTPFYKVTASVESLSGNDIVLAVGLSNFGKAVVTAFPDRGVLSLVEEYLHADGIIGRGETPPRSSSTVCCGVIVNPRQLEGFTSCGNDEYVLVRVKSGERIVYYAGASWSGQIDGGEKTWNIYLKRNGWESMNELYAPVSISE